jgi:hypothetical protein
MDKRLGVGRGYFSNVLTGRVELKQSHVTAILLSAGLHPGVFFEVVYPKDRPFGPLPARSDLISQLEAVGITPEPAPPPPLPPPAAPVDPAQLRPFVEDIVHQALASSRRRRRGRGKRAKRAKDSPRNTAPAKH